MKLITTSIAAFALAALFATGAQAIDGNHKPASRENAARLSGQHQAPQFKVTLADNRKPDPRHQSAPQHRPDPKPQPTAQHKPDPKPQPAPQHRPDPKPQSAPQHKPVGQVKLSTIDDHRKPDPHHQPAPQHRPDPHHQPDPQHRPDPHHGPGAVLTRQQSFVNECNRQIARSGSPYKNGYCVLSGTHLSMQLTPHHQYRDNIQRIDPRHMSDKRMQRFCSLFNSTTLVTEVEYRFLDDRGNVFKTIHLRDRDCR